MKLSKKTDYALRAIFTLVENHGGDPVSIADLAYTNRIPKRFLEHIMLDMKTQGWVASTAGKHGGYRLAKAPEEITMGEIVRFFDGILAPIGCVSITRYEPCKQERVCRFRRLMLNIRNYVASMMDKATLASVFAESIVTQREVMDVNLVGGDGI
jgi:Rrf2 family protein